MKNNTKTFNTGFFISISAFLVLCVAICWLPFYFAKHPALLPFSNLTGPVGDTIGGTMGPFIAIAASALTFLAFWIQYKANEQQRLDITSERFDNRFYEMLSLHRENVGELTYTYFVRKGGQSNGELEKECGEKRKVFKLIYEHYKELSEELEPLFSKAEEATIYNPEYLRKLGENKTLFERKLNFKDLARIDIAYTIIFFGLSSEDQITVGKLLNTPYNPEFISRVIRLASLKPKVESKHWPTWKSVRDLSLPNRYAIHRCYAASIRPSDAATCGPLQRRDRLFLNSLFYGDWYHKYYGGHQHRLGHYFRHIFQMVSLIDDSQQFDYAEKYAYVKLIRTQLSNYEQILLCLNSLSQVGRGWEYHSRVEHNCPKPVTKQLITKYNLVKNIPSDSAIRGLELLKFYPHVDYEACTSPDIRKEREKLVAIYQQTEKSASSASASSTPTSLTRFIRCWRQSKKRDDSLDQNQAV